MKETKSRLRIGQGMDIHPLVRGRKLVLGGVEIPADFGLEGHSDADALLHALIDALLGAAGKLDIGHHFPNSDPRWKNIDSKVMLRAVWEDLKKEDYVVCNVDSTVLAEAPKLSPYIPKMKEVISSILEIGPEQCSIKATTTEKLGFVGRGEGILASCVVLLEQGAI